LELSGSKELDELEEEVRRLVSERRHADEAIVQLEADMTVKNSEIKNLQIELNTLENTVVQLERQKVEAEKRLKQLDNQINELECIGRELKVKIGEENSRLMNLRNENTLAKENAVKENAEMTKAKEQLRVLEEQEKQLNATLLQRNNVIENSAIQLTKLESEQTASENEIQRVEKENEKLLNIKNRLNYLIETSDIDGIIREQSDLMAFAPVGAGQSGSYGQFGQNEAKMTNASPFDTQIDPFADVQHSGRFI
uniref:Uncharacterized protein n=1 Tax=Anisakis simplex TaxID=6269 RepID=A0A0M3KGN5_ANISI